MAPITSLVFSDEYPNKAEREICKRYWERFPDGSFVYEPAQLARKMRKKPFGFDFDVAMRCQAHTDIKCKCGEWLIFDTRNDLQKWLASQSQQWTCDTCETAERAEKAARVAAERAAESDAEAARVASVAAAEQAHQDRLWECVQNQFPMGELAAPQSVHLRFAIHWFALLLQAGPSWNEGIPALDTLKPPLTGDGSDEIEIVRALQALRLLYADHESLLLAKSTSVSMRTRWRLSAPQHAELTRKYVAEALQIMPDPGAWPNYWKNQYVDVFSDIAGMECHRFWYMIRKRYKIIVVDGNQLGDILDEALASLSVGQVACLMWRAAKGIRDNYANRSDATDRDLARWTLKCLRGLVDYWKNHSTRVKIFKLKARGLATEVALGIMSGTMKPWYAVALRDVEERMHSVPQVARRGSSHAQKFVVQF